jgi:Protein of unknown function (DUF1822)
MTSTIEMLTEIYPEHIWIDLSQTVKLESKLSVEQFQDRDYNLSRVDLNRLCMVAIKKWLSEVFDLELKSVFPCVLGEKENLEFISKLVNGFALQLGKTRLVFIPSQSIDLTEIEIPQEWVDLPNWAADYYVPIQVDVEGKYLHLWTFISHYDLKNNCEFDPVFRNYEIPDLIETRNLDVLFTACELHALGELTPKRAALDIVPALATDDANQLIEQLQQHRSAFSPRLELLFKRWGAILNDDRSLERYLKLQGLVTASTNKLTTPLVVLNRRLQQAGSGVTELINAVYVTFKDFPDKPLLTPGFMGWKQNNPDWLSSVPVRLWGDSTIPKPKFALFAVLGDDLSTETKIQEAINTLYENQDPAYEVKQLSNLHSSQEQLLYLMQYTTNETIRWEVAGCLWKIDPDADNSPHWQRQITDLGSLTQEHKLGLMIATIPLPDKKTRAVLAHVYEIGNQELPSNVRLTLLSEENHQIDQSESRPQDPYVRLYFTATIGDRFNICISVNNLNITEAFEVKR